MYKSNTYITHKHLYYLNNWVFPKLELISKNLANLPNISVTEKRQNVWILNGHPS